MSVITPEGRGFREPLTCDQSETVIIFCTGSRCYIGRAVTKTEGAEQKPNLRRDLPISEVYEIVSIQGLVPGSIHGGSPNLLYQSYVMPSNLQNVTGTPVECMNVVNMEWFYYPDEPIVAVARAMIKALAASKSKDARSQQV